MYRIHRQVVVTGKFSFTIIVIFIMLLFTLIYVKMACLYPHVHVVIM